MKPGLTGASASTRHGVLRIEASDGRPASPASRAVGIAAFAICAGLVTLGLYGMFSSK